ncbi:MAG: hypothetical protein LBJ48_06175 [Coriobacteriales bacterium]|nr:hypothetical protein [Coriobacteriales bacterium]
MASGRLKILSCGGDERSAWADIAILGTQPVVSPELAVLLLDHYPNLAEHACKNAQGGARVQAQREPATFGDRIIGALLPHAVEHLAIELLVRAYPGQVFAGNTRWISRETQQMRVRISHPAQTALSEQRATGPDTHEPQGSTSPGSLIPLSSPSQAALFEAIELLNGLLATCQ